MKQKKTALGLMVGFALVNPLTGSTQPLLEEVVVTAQKRESSLADTAIAITTLSGEQRIALGIYSPQDVAHFTPSMS